MQPDRDLVVPRSALAIARVLLTRAVVVLLAASACAPPATEADPRRLDVLGAAGDPWPSADAEQLDRFERGRVVFGHRFDRAGGLGPLVNASSCAACHEKPVLGGTASRYRNVFVVANAEPVPKVVAQEQFAIDDRVRAPDEPGTRSVARNPLPLFGLGLLAEIPADEILRRHDPNDVDGDGISGRVNLERGFVGRFGHKAQIATLAGFVRAALRDHVGVTTRGVETDDLLLEDGPIEVPTADDDAIADPELHGGDLEDLLAFVGLLAGPAPSRASADAEHGRAAFVRFGCDVCHVPALDGPRGSIPAFTDLLLHDMGDSLADDVRVGEADRSEFRTAPLWGVAAHGPFLHDGRADTLDDAIRWHAGEAAAARRSYVTSSPSDRDAVLAFLASLGEPDARTDGLLPLESSLPSVGAAGGPMAPLSSDEQAAFARGRVIFDRDFAVASGLGPRFNGDSCRSCHFDDAVGGSGPADVDVIRHGTLVSDGFVAPTIGTIAHRHDTSWSRPRVDAQANLFERRQTPTILGLGLVDAIRDTTIAARSDPDDADGDGISGRVRVLPDGRVGRFGWKAGVPTLAEFARDAFANELGITLPPDASPFGTDEDDDAAADPELARAELDDVVLFMARLGPPPRRSSDPIAEARGELVFGHVGCDRCHVPVLATTDGTPVPLYSDLLLHDVAPATAVLVPDGDAGREFRTPPLWGLGASAPYLHDGRAETIDAAIALHDGEAAASRDRVTALQADDRDALLAFLHSL